MHARRLITLPALAALAAGLAMSLDTTATAQGTTAFTYQGFLNDNGAPANGTYDFQAVLYAGLFDPLPVGLPICYDNVPVTNGLLTLPLEFGDVYNGSPRFLSILVRADTGLTCASTTGFTGLPRVQLTPTPFASEARNARTLADIESTFYARTDIDEFFYGNVTMYEPFYVSDSNNIVGDLSSTSSLGCRLSFESTSSSRSWTIGATGSSSIEGGDRFSIFDVTSSTPCLVIEGGGSGNVGIGTTNPNQLLDVIDGRFRVATTATGSGNVFADVTAQEHGLLGVMNENGGYYIYAGQSQLSGAADVGAQLLVCDINGGGRGGFQINSANNCTMIAQVKSFMVDNPDDETTDIYYACVEGPEAAMYVRGTGQLVNGEATVTLPRHFTAMALAEGITVQITPLSADCNGIAVVKKGTDAFVVKELMRGTSNADFDWEVKAVRAGFEDFEVVRPKGIMNPPKPEFVPVN